MDNMDFYPLPDKENIATAYVGKSLKDVPVPSAVLDLAKIRNNCQLMLNAVKELNVDFRAHVKTHKTAELTRYQLGHDSKDVRLICSTVAELEHLIPLLEEYRQAGAKIDVLYGIPPGRSHTQRLRKCLEILKGCVTLMLDHPSQLATVHELRNSTDIPVKVFLKTDSGYHRAGVGPTSTTMQNLVKAVLDLESKGEVQLTGFYSHNSLSYGGSSPAEAMDNLRAEVEACMQAALRNTPQGYIESLKRPLAISCGASPTAVSLQNLLSQNTAHTQSANDLRKSLAAARAANIHFEIHAGVYPTLDMQQVSASSRDLGARPEDNIAFTVLTEVCSTYPDRTEHPEALINAGCIALAREPCKSYRGHGIITSWNMHQDYDPYSREKRIIVDRVSQEHGILQWEDRGKKEPLPLEYGQLLQIWPNHACITGGQYGWYLIVDSESGDADIVRDVWVRWRGW